MTASAELAAPRRRSVAPAVAAKGRRRRRWSSTLLFAVLFAGYFTLGAVMILRWNFFDPDGPSRVANAGYALMSRDPHLSAIGFVWNPLPSLVEMPLLSLSHWWPALRTDGLASVVQSAAFMAGAALFVRQIAVDRGTGPWVRRLAVTCFAVNPVILVYGAAGMSEAAELFCLLWATRYLMLWTRTRRVDQLAWAAIAIGVGYLARYEIAFTAVGVGLFVLLVSLIGSAEGIRGAWPRATLNVLIVGFPVLTSFTVWALTGWITTGDLFATLSSNYGNAGQIATAAGRGVTAERSGNDIPLVIASRQLAMQPFVGLAVVLTAALAVLRRRADHLVPIATFGSVLTFSVWGQFSGTTFGWFRFYILAIPLVVVVALLCWTDAPRGSATRWARGTGAALLSLSLVVGAPVTAVSMLNPQIGNQHLQFGWRSIVFPDRYPADELWYRRLRHDDRLIAKYLDEQRLPDGSVLMDTFAGWGIWLASDRPMQFVVTSDYDFTLALSRPWANGIRYILVSNPALNDAPDAINRQYPDLWSNGSGFASLVYSALGATGQERWRIYRVDGPPQRV